MTTSVVIPAYKGKDLLQKNLPSILKLGADEIVIVDDASPDGTSEFLQKEYPKIKVIKHGKNTRFPTSVNDGFAAASGEIVLLLNQDTTPDSTALKTILSHFQDPQVFAVNLNENSRSWAKAEFKNGFLEFTNGVLDDQMHTSFWGSGGSCAFRKSLWDKLGGFDSVFTPGYFEDLDLGWRAHLAGCKILWDPQAKITHAAESTNKEEFEPAYLRRIKERNYLITHWKNLDFGRLLQHKFFLILRILRHPGYLLPTLMAFIHLPHIIACRIKQKPLTLQHNPFVTES
ncbi:MAG: Glycosyl transferase, family 2 [Candidatus Woesebacteria bacterium GW2011_GWA1_43_12]|uniref:Glycosyl transferase, family 2 n=1 Tax=Candidatus Woesebacteria bacterium GW2011_GWA1_43_12 TaxID=1618557 RepID=A0A0G1FSZ3_9BACT|nr:MAG: Glycosyl transferase, family 2 [Candidatus Woesebacteria bacterium GW2011_GWA1_43_12]